MNNEQLTINNGQWTMDNEKLRESFILDPKIECGNPMSTAEMLKEAKNYALAFFREWEERPNSRFASMYLHQARTFLRAMGYTERNSSIIVEDEWFQVWYNKQNNKNEETSNGGTPNEQ